MKELIVRSKNPAALDQTLSQMGGRVGQNSDGSYTQDSNGHYSVRGINIGFLAYAIRQQGYAEVVGEREIPS